MRSCRKILLASPGGGGWRSGRTSWLVMVWAEGGWPVTRPSKGLLMVFACPLGRLRRDPWSANGSANVNVSDGVSGDDDGDDDHENCHANGNVCVHFLLTSQVESCHASNGSCGLFSSGPSPSPSSRVDANPWDRLHLTDSICLWGRSLCRFRTGCHYCRVSRPFFPVS